jgi:hypothetical protein
MNIFQPFIWEMESIFGVLSNHWFVLTLSSTTNLIECVHQDDIDEFSRNSHYSTVFKYIKLDLKYVVVMDIKKNIYRVKGSCLELISNPLADIGESVIILNGSSSGKIGFIKYLSWHLKDKCFLYRIEVDRILKKRIYRDRDIAVVVES